MHRRKKRASAACAVRDLGCIAAHGMFACDGAGCYIFTSKGKPATAFLFELIARLQSSATVSMIDIRAYALWLGSDTSA